jgi:hypothetical protein
MSIVFSRTIDQKIAITRNTTVIEMKQNSTSSSEISFFTALMNVRFWSSHVMIDTSITSGTCPA